jgi:hypothetical protein
MTSSSPRLARFSPIQMAGMVLMAGAAVAGAGLFMFSHSLKTPERTVIVNPALFPHIGKRGFNDSCVGLSIHLHCRLHRKSINSH